MTSTRRDAKRRKRSFDHIIPWSKGGRHTVDNLRIACLSCNIRRGNRDIEIVEVAA